MKYYYTPVQNKLSSRNIICYCVDPLSILAYIGLGIIRTVGGVAMKFAPEIHTCFARRCATHRRNRRTNNEDIRQTTQQTLTTT